MNARKYFHLLFPLLALIISGCSSVPDQSLINEKRPVTLAESSDLYAVVKLPITYNDDSFDPLRGVLLHPGKYILEAEDAGHWFFRSPVPLNLLMYDFGRIVDGTSIYGGLMISKDAASPRPYCAYVDGDNAAEKVVIWELGKEFAKDRGLKWKLSTDSEEASATR
ncbi:MAG: hypothetical protein WC360_01390 [Opitutales bacterium]|jgi:hypothetical protein